MAGGIQRYTVRRLSPIGREREREREENGAERGGLAEMLEQRKGMSSQVSTFYAKVRSNHPSRQNYHHIDCHYTIIAYRTQSTSMHFRILLANQKIGTDL